jgi:hypothetical protein
MAQQSSMLTNASFPLRQSNNNGFLTAKMAMPFKSINMTQGSGLSNSLMIYNNKSGGGVGSHDSSSYIYQKKNIAIGKSMTKVGLPQDAAISFRSLDNNLVNTRLRKARSGGCVAPAKKGANISFGSGGGCCSANTLAYKKNLPN